MQVLILKGGPRVSHPALSPHPLTRTALDFAPRALWLIPVAGAVAAYFDLIHCYLLGMPLREGRRVGLVPLATVPSIRQCSRESMTVRRETWALGAHQEILAGEYAIE